MENKIKAITVALENELHERDFYLSQSRKTENVPGRFAENCCCCKSSINGGHVEGHSILNRIFISLIFLFS